MAGGRTAHWRALVATGLAWAALAAADACAAVCTWTGSWDNTPSSAGDVIVIRSGGNLTWGGGLPDTVASWTQEDTYASTVTIQTVYGAAGFTNFTISGDCIISNGVWMHAANTTVEANRLRVTIGGRLILGPLGQINVTAKGYQQAAGPGGSGPDHAWIGGCHAGRGGWANGYIDTSQKPFPTTYGSPTAPVNLGSGGWHAGGGGAVYLAVSGPATVEGT